MKQRRQVGELDGYFRVFAPETGLHNLQGAPKKRFRLREPVHGLKHLCNVVEAPGDIRKVLPVALLRNPQGTPKKGFRLCMESRAEGEEMR